MGVDYYARAVVGVRIDVENLFKMVPVEACKHTEAAGQKFCPKCGKEQNQKEKQPIEGYDQDNEKLLGFSTYFTTDNHEVVVGYGTDSTHSERSETEMLDDKHIPSDSIHQVRLDLKEKLEPLGLWEEANFGIWCVMLCSY